MKDSPKTERNTRFCGRIELDIQGFVPHNPPSRSHAFLLDGVLNMLLSDEEVQERLESPLNLMNRLRKATTPSHSPCLPPNSDDLNLDIDEKVAVGKLRSNAASIMALSLAELKQRIQDIQKPEKLAQIAAEMNKVLVSRQDDKDKNSQPQIIVYAPQLINEAHFGESIVHEDV